MKQIKEIGLVENTINEIKSFLSSNGTLPFVLFSGGKDSLTALALVAVACNSLGKEVTAVHADTTAGIPGNLDYVREACQSLSVKLITVRPEEDYFTLAQKKGLPRFGARWCCGELKVKPLAKYLKNKKADKIVFDGIRAAESRQRAAMERLSWHKRFNCQVYHPIMYWSEENVLNYLRERKLTINPLYNKGFKRASECWCGVFKGVAEFRLLRDTYPSFFDRLVELESCMRNGSSYLFKNGQRIYLRDLRKETSQSINIKREREGVTSSEHKSAGSDRR